MKTKKKFVKNDFLNNLTIGYLSTCDLDWEAITQLLNVLEKLDFSCAKYLICGMMDCTNGKICL